jgi:hypothetical protein
VKKKFRFDHLLCFFVFVIGNQFSVVHYNTLSLIGLVIFWISLKSTNNFMAYISGIIFCLFLFVKINNLIFIPFIILYFYFFRDIKRILKFLIGMLIGGSIIFIQLHNLVGFNNFIQSTKEHIIIITNFKDPNYDLINVLKQYLRDWIFVVFIVPLAYLVERFNILAIKFKNIPFILILIIFYYHQKENMLYSVVSYGLFLAYYNKLVSFDQLMFSFAAMILLPLGSAEGLDSIAYMALMPGYILISSNLDNFKIFFINNEILCGKNFNRYREGLLIFICGIFMAFSGAWFDGPRYKLISTKTVGENFFVTSPRKASIIGELQLALSKHGLGKKDRILFFESTPMFHFMFDVKPLYGQPWVHISSPSYLRFRLNKDDNIDAVVRFKGQPLGGNWNFADPAVSDATAPHTFARNPEHLKVLQGFLKKNNFMLRGEYDLFEIWLK